MENEDNIFYVREIQTIELVAEYSKDFNLVKILIDNFIDVTIYMFGEFKNNYKYKEKRTITQWLWGNEYE